MRTRSAAVELTWNGAAVKSKMLGQTTEITYTDPASGEADSLDISIHDRDRQWTVAWLPDVYKRQAVCGGAPPGRKDRKRR